MPNSTLSINVCLHRSLLDILHWITILPTDITIFMCMTFLCFGWDFVRYNLLTEFNCNLHYTDMTRVVLDIQTKYDNFTCIMFIHHTNNWYIT
jgi:hypothetical protein